MPEEISKTIGIYCAKANSPKNKELYWEQFKYGANNRFMHKKCLIYFGFTRVLRLIMVCKDCFTKS